jgi:hypothetical protein
MKPTNASKTNPPNLVTLIPRGLSFHSKVFRKIFKTQFEIVGEKENESKCQTTGKKFLGRSNQMEQHKKIDLSQRMQVSFRPFKSV